MVSNAIIKLGSPTPSFAEASSFFEPTAMCYFEQIRFACGFWKWGKFREQCNKEHRTGETCGLKLVFSPEDQGKDCDACRKIVVKQRRITKMTTDLGRWRRQGNRTATIEMTESEVAGLRREIQDLWKQHLEGEFGGPQKLSKASRRSS